MGSEADLARLAHHQGQTDLVERGGEVYLLTCVEIPDAPGVYVTDFLAFDSGIVNIATTSDGDNWSGCAVTEQRKKNRRLRQRLQCKGTKSAKRLLKKRSKKEARFVADVNHCISKKIVTEAERTSRGITHENLTGIRERGRLRKPQRTELNSWAFAQLFAFIAYKARLRGLPVLVVDAVHFPALPAMWLGGAAEPPHERINSSHAETSAMVREATGQAGAGRRPYSGRFRPPGMAGRFRAAACQRLYMGHDARGRQTNMASTSSFSFLRKASSSVAQRRRFLPGVLAHCWVVPIRTPSAARSIFHASCEVSA